MVADVSACGSTDGKKAWLISVHRTQFGKKIFILSLRGNHRHCTTVLIYGCRLITICIILSSRASTYFLVTCTHSYVLVALLSVYYFENKIYKICHTKKGRPCTSYGAQRTTDIKDVAGFGVECVPHCISSQMHIKCSLLVNKA